jgi:hypothetical protein
MLLRGVRLSTIVIADDIFESVHPLMVMTIRHCIIPPTHRAEGRSVKSSLSLTPSVYPIVSYYSSHLLYLVPETNPAVHYGIYGFEPTRVLIYHLVLNDLTSLSVAPPFPSSATTFQ